MCISTYAVLDDIANKYQTLWTSSEAEPQESAGQSSEAPKETEGAAAPEATAEKAE